MSRPDLSVIVDIGTQDFDDEDLIQYLQDGESTSSHNIRHYPPFVIITFDSGQCQIKAVSKTGTQFQGTNIYVCKFRTKFEKHLNELKEYLISNYRHDTHTEYLSNPSDHELNFAYVPDFQFSMFYLSALLRFNGSKLLHLILDNCNLTNAKGFTFFNLYFPDLKRISLPNNNFTDKKAVKRELQTYKIDFDDDSDHQEEEAEPETLDWGYPNDFDQSPQQITPINQDKSEIIPILHRFIFDLCTNPASIHAYLDDDAVCSVSFKNQKGNATMESLIGSNRNLTFNSPPDQKHGATAIADFFQTMFPDGFPGTPDTENVVLVGNQFYHAVMSGTFEDLKFSLSFIVIGKNGGLLISNLHLAFQILYKKA